MMTSDQLLKKTKEYLPLFEAASLTPIDEGGSDRQFYRCRSKVGTSLILVHYNQTKAENSLYAEHALFLKKHHLAVPAVLHWCPEECLLWLQDLGEKNLWSQRNAPWKVRRSFYELALQEAARLHRLPLEEATKEITLQPAFEETLYRWEQDYFFEYALGSLFQIDFQTRSSLAASPFLHNLAKELAALPRQLIHRDLQSQNILLFENKPWLIDFQGMRAGLACYDLASLLCDPYVLLTPSEQKELLHFYQQEMEKHGVFFSFDIEKTFWQCAVQRLMQALGAYGFLGLHRGKSHFLQHVPSALNGLCHALKQLEPNDHLTEFSDLMTSLSLSFIP